MFGSVVVFSSLFFSIISFSKPTKIPFLGSLKLNLVTVNVVSVTPLLNYIQGTQRGLTIGIVNYARSLHGVQVGVVNIVRNNPKGRRWLPIVNWN